MEPFSIQVLPRDLTLIRKAKGITLAQIAQATKISARYLEAIENGAFHKLPGGVYSLNYVRQYAQAIGDHDEALVDYYLETANDAEPPVDNLPPAPFWFDRVKGYLRSYLGGSDNLSSPEFATSAMATARPRRSVGR